MTDTTSSVLVHCDSVGRTYGSGPNAVVAVHDATCKIWPSERIALVGPSGSGKSTLLHLIAGLEWPTAGSISWPALGDRTTLRPGPVAIVFQGPSLLPPLDVIENVALPLVLDGADQGEARERASAALALLDLGELHAKLPEELSGGQMQRVAVARALAPRPRLLLADEPTGQLDHDTADHVITILVRAALETDAALVVSTHDPAVADRLDQIWPVADGRLTVGRRVPRDETCSA
jgi:ABC-type lipoprotein export system ATPase subunit